MTYRLLPWDVHGAQKKMGFWNSNQTLEGGVIGCIF
jgi:hypothetical protein